MPVQPMPRIYMVANASGRLTQLKRLATKTNETSKHKGSKQMTEDRQPKILGYVDYIKKNFREQKYFAFDTGRKFIVDGKKIKMLPTEYSKLAKKTEFYINVDPDVKKVIYYAFDLDDCSEKVKKDEMLGNFEWDKVVEQIYSFLTLHLKE